MENFILNSLPIWFCWWSQSARIVCSKNNSWQVAYNFCSRNYILYCLFLTDSVLLFSVSNDKREISANRFLSCHWMILLFRSINPSLKLRGCVQRLLRALITRELFDVENILSPTTFACTNRTYRTITCGRFMSLCLFIVLLNVVSLMSERKKKK